MFKLFLHCSVESWQRIGFFRRTSSTGNIHSAIVDISIMNLSSLNVDVLLYLMKFVKPVDRFNLVLSGVLKGFENANEGIDLRERYSEFLFWMKCKCNQIVLRPELKTLGLNWGCVVTVRIS